jgi:hypothetical protein
MGPYNKARGRWRRTGLNWIRTHYVNPPGEEDRRGGKKPEGREDSDLAMDLMGHPYRITLPCWLRTNPIIFS